jgi:uncharacterized membrane protein
MYQIIDPIDEVLFFLQLNQQFNLFLISLLMLIFVLASIMDSQDDYYLYFLIFN